MKNELLTCLAELKSALDKENLPFILGGGMGLYLYHTFLQTSPSFRYEKVITETRSTDDLDVFLTAEIIIDADKMNKIKDVLVSLDYSPVEGALYYHFKKIISPGNEVKIDLLSAPVSDEEKSLVKINSFRIKPKKAENIHAYLRQEAKSIDQNLNKVNISGFSQNQDLKDPFIYLPSAYNYLILKLNAFKDRVNDQRKANGIYHVFDIFSIVTRMNENDWKIAIDHYQKDKDLEYLIKTIDSCHKYFSSKTDMGIIRLKENIKYQQHKEIYDQYLDNFIEDLKELFPKP